MFCIENTSTICDIESLITYIIVVIRIKYPIVLIMNYKYA